ncbi:hypothetical protein P8452_71410 [Trifolium repens]|nr:hypothetical protein P8452_71410 [Trifolium repens]
MVAPKMARYCRIVQKILLWNQNNFGVPTSFRVVIVSIQVSFSGRQVLRSKDQDETDRWGREPGRRTKLFRFHHYIDSIDVMART